MHTIHRNKNGRHPAETEAHGQRYENEDISFKHPGSEVTNTNKVDAEMHARTTAVKKGFFYCKTVCYKDSKHVTEGKPGGRRKGKQRE